MAGCKKVISLLLCICKINFFGERCAILKHKDFLLFQKRSSIGSSPRGSNRFCFHLILTLPRNFRFQVSCHLVCMDYYYHFHQTIGTVGKNLFQFQLIQILWCIFYSGVTGCLLSLAFLANHNLRTMEGSQNCVC